MSVFKHGVRPLSRRHGLAAMFVAGAGLTALLGAPAFAAEADLVLFNGKVITVDKAFSVQQALAVRGGKIVAVGGAEVAAEYTAPVRIDLKGRTVMPGFIDTHLHVIPLAPRQVDILGAKSIEDIKALVRAKAAALGPGEWITGYGWDEALFTEKRNLVKADLDQAAPNNPVALTRAGGHSIAGNSLALKIAKIDKATADPPGGLIEKGPDGEPNGVIRERNSLFLDHVPAETWAEMKGPYIAAMRKLPPLGITSFHSASTSIDDEPIGAGGLANSGAGLTIRRLQEIQRDTDHTLPRVTAYIAFPGEARMKAFGRKSGDGDEWVRVGGIGEMPVDGGFTGPTAWTLADYKGLPGFRGKGRYTDAELQAIVDVSARNGWQMAMHAIGDAAIVQTVNAYAKALDTYPEVRARDHRWFLDHFTIMPPDATMTKMADYKVRIAQQPNFLYNLEGRYRSTLDDWRLEHNNAVATPSKKFGIPVAFGSDNLPIGPMVGVYAAVTRKGMSGEVIGPQEAVSIQEAIRAYTEVGAYLSWEEKLKGTLEVGKLGDMIVLDADPLTVDPGGLRDIKVDLTIINGKVVYERGLSRP